MFFLPFGHLPLQELQWKLYCRYWQTANTRTPTSLFRAFLARTLGLQSGSVNLFMVKRKILKINGRREIRPHLYADCELVEGERAISLPVLWWAPIYKSETSTAVHGCHYLGDMAVHIREALARRWVGVCVPLALSLSCLELSEPTFATFPYKMIVNYLGVYDNK